MTLQLGEILADKYRIVRLLGKGGMGEVYEGENLRIRRRVAIKTLLSAVSSKPDVVQRFEREAQAAGRIGSEHIVEVLDLGDLPDQSRYMVMEFLEGTTLSDRIVSRGRIPAREAARIVAELCDGLGAAHNAGIIHRDLKPANIFLLHSKHGRADFVKILDFGVSKFSVLGDELSMTSTGAVVGTPYYMSPEQAKGAKFIDARSDLYSVGVILYETITGQVPFNAQTFNELIFKIALETPPPPESFVPDLDPRMASMIRRAMARDSADRFQSAAEFKQTLDAWAADFDRGVPAHGAQAMGWNSPQGSPQLLPGASPHGSAQFAYPGAQQPMQGYQAPQLGGTQLMAPAPSPAVGPLAQTTPRAKSSTVPLLIAFGILGFGAVSIGAAFAFRSPKASAEGSSPTATAATTANRPANPTESTSAPAKTADGPSASGAALSSLPSAAGTVISLEDAAAPSAQAAPLNPGVTSHPVTNQGSLVPPIAHTAPPPPSTAKPGGRAISGSLD